MTSLTAYYAGAIPTPHTLACSFHAIGVQVIYITATNAKMLGSSKPQFVFVVAAVEKGVHFRRCDR